MNPEECTCVEEVLVVENPIPTQNIPEDSDPIAIDLADTFSLDDAEIEIRPVGVIGGSPDANPGDDNNPDPVDSPGDNPGSDSQPPIVEAEIVDGQIILDPIEDQNGIQEFEVVATTPDGQEVTDNFAVIVDPVDDPFELKEEIPDVDFVANQNSISIKIDDFFQDPDSDLEDVEISIQSNTNPDLIQSRIEGDNLIIETDLTAPGSSDITIEATSGGETIEDTFTVNVDENICIKADPSESGDSPDLLLDPEIDTVDVALFERDNGTNLYTDNPDEISGLLENGELYRVSASEPGYRGLAEDGDDISPVARFYDTQSNSNFFTADEGEADFFRNNLADRFREERSSHFAYDNAEVNPEAIPVYRFIDQTNGSHLFTLDQSEGSGLASEGVAYYVLSEEVLI